jgi:hypothetical protein
VDAVDGALNDAAYGGTSNNDVCRIDVINGQADYNSADCGFLITS